MPLPQELAFKLTNRVTCAVSIATSERDPDIHHRLTRKADDLELSIVARAVEATGRSNPM